MSNKPCSLMTAYAEGSIVSRELRDMLSEEAAAERFDRELLRLEAQYGLDHGGHTESADSYVEPIRKQLNK